MPKIIALQTSNQSLRHLLQQHGYNVIDMYEAHHQRASVDAYLYTTYHPDAFTSYHAPAESTEMLLNTANEDTPLATTIMLNISHLEPEQVVLTLTQRFEERP